MDAKPQSKKGGDVAARLLQKMLMPIVAGAASAAATYAAKKAPQLLDGKVLPKVRELVTGAGGAAHDLPTKAKAAAEGAGDVAERLTDRARETVKNVTGSNGRRDRTLSPEELDRHLHERSRARAARRKAAR
jgi:hypothetical protein